MKLYDVFDSKGKFLQQISEYEIDPNFKNAGMKDGTVQEREASYDDALKDCRARRAREYPAGGDQLDAAYKARHGDFTGQDAIDTKIAQVKASIPKPTPPPTDVPETPPINPEMVPGSHLTTEPAPSTDAQPAEGMPADHATLGDQTNPSGSTPDATTTT